MNERTYIFYNKVGRETHFSLAVQLFCEWFRNEITRHQYKSGESEQTGPPRKKWLTGLASSWTFLDKKGQKPKFQIFCKTSNFLACFGGFSAWLGLCHWVGKKNIYTYVSLNSGANNAANMAIAPGTTLMIVESKIIMRRRFRDLTRNWSAAITMISDIISLSRAPKL